MVAWDEANERRFLLTIIHVQAPTAPNWQEVARLMGPEYSANGLRQKYAKLREAATKEFDALVRGGEGTSQATPKRRGGAKAEGSAAKSTGKRKGKKAKGEDEDADAEGEEDELAGDNTPYKKVKLELREEPCDGDVVG